MEPATHNEALARHQTSTTRLQSGILALLQEIDDLKSTVEDQEKIIAAYEAWVEKVSAELESRKSDDAINPDEWVKRWYGVELKTEEA